MRNFWWTHKDSNLGQTGYEPVALPTELWVLAVKQEKISVMSCLVKHVNPYKIEIFLELPTCP